MAIMSRLQVLAVVLLVLCSACTAFECGVYFSEMNRQFVKKNVANRSRENVSHVGFTKLFFLQRCRCAVSNPEPCLDRAEYKVVQGHHDRQSAGTSISVLLQHHAVPRGRPAWSIWSVNGLYPIQDVVFSLFSWWRVFLRLVAG